ncbi:hypothetical protein [Nocardia otitidiscaviarum]|uniref:hypothetical protein n=1 Tax=Nocardia otitidiscaviarum TaxID=1823 RepID=UPI0004A767F3|nr:hypothetical protein [Nocardia otitidiscaviarum]
MALATQADVETILGRPLTTEEAALVASQLDEASDLVLGYLKCPPATPTPDAVVRVVAAMVAAVITRPAHTPLNADQVNAGPYGWRFTEGSTAGGPWLTAALKMRLAPYRCSVASVPLVSERYES